MLVDVGKKPKLLGVIGDPIDHSLSPLLHNCIIKNEGLDYVYLPFHIKFAELPAFLEAARLLPIHGFNATMPHKKGLVTLCDELRGDAAAFGAVNTVKNENGRLIGYNTDGEGFVRAMEQHGLTPAGKKFVILGAGGAAEAIIKKLRLCGAEEITVFNRSAGKLKNLLSVCPGITGELWAEEKLNAAAAGADILVNCTPMGMHGVAAQFEHFDFLKNSRAAVVDLIYNPMETALLKEARRLGLTAMSGLSMLLWQGVLALELFTDTTLDRAANVALVEEELKRRGLLCCY